MRSMVRCDSGEGRGTALTPLQFADQRALTRMQGVWLLNKKSDNLENRQREDDLGEEADGECEGAEDR